MLISSRESTDIGQGTQRDHEQCLNLVQEDHLLLHPQSHQFLVTGLTTEAQSSTDNKDPEVFHQLVGIAARAINTSQEAYSQLGAEKPFLLRPSVFPSLIFPNSILEEVTSGMSKISLRCAHHCPFWDHQQRLKA